MVDNTTKVDEKLQKLAARFRRGFAKLYPITNEEIRAVQEAVHKQRKEGQKTQQTSQGKEPRRLGQGPGKKGKPIKASGKLTKFAERNVKKSGGGFAFRKRGRPLLRAKKHKKPAKEKTTSSTVSGVNELNPS